METYLVTGAAGFIGYYLSKALTNSGKQVVGIDNLNDYYDINLKLNRLELLKDEKNFKFIKGDISDVRFYGVIERNKPLQAILDVLEETGVKFEVTPSGKEKKLIVY